MYALLDVQRTAKGLPALHALETYAPHPVYDSGTGPEETRYRRLNDLAATFAVDVAWLNQPIEGLKLKEDARKIKFVLGKGSFDDYGIDVLLEAKFRPSVPPALAGRCSWAYLSFPGGNYQPYLTPENPAWETLRIFLTAVQLTYAFITLDTDSPSGPDEYEHFQRAWRGKYYSVFLGPELVRLIPGDLLDPDAGFSQIERLSEDVWFTIARGALYQPELKFDKVEAQLHDAAIAPLWAFLETILPSDLT